MNNNIIDIFDEEETGIHLTKLKGKIIRDGNCPLKKIIACEDCKFYDGWGVDTIEYEVHVYCNHPNLIDTKKLKLTREESEKNNNKKRRFRKNKKKDKTKFGCVVKECNKKAKHKAKIYGINGFQTDITGERFPIINKNEIFIQDFCSKHFNRLKKCDNFIKEI